MKTIQHARVSVASDPKLLGRIIEYREFSNREIVKDPNLMNYLARHRGAL